MASASAQQPPPQPTAPVKAGGEPTFDMRGIFGCLGVFLVLIVGFGSCTLWLDSCGRDNTSGSRELARNQPTEIRVSARGLHADYSNNMDGASRRYDGKILIVSGVIRAVERDLEGNPYILLWGSEFRDRDGIPRRGKVQCYIRDESVWASMSLGQTVTLRCYCEGCLGLPTLNYCQPSP